jgi:hypothetical protein
MQTSIRSIAAALLAVAAIAFMPACESDQQYEPEPESFIAQPGLTLKPSAREVYEGEVVTVSTRNSNVAGRNPEVVWATTGGELTPVDNGVFARVHFDRPGTYIISATLTVNGQPVDNDSITVTVKPLMRR